MKKLKFRAWVGSENTDFINMPSHYEYDITLVNGKYASVEAGWDIQGTYENVPVEQYTGLKDNNGKEIYEGDIVRCWNGLDYLDGSVKWSENSAAYFVKYFEKKDCFDEDDWLCDCYCEVIGNVHENPELLEKKK